MHEDLAFLNGLDSAQLHAEGRNRSRRLAGSTWDMAVCLLAIDERKTYWERKYTSTVQYAVMEFGLDGHRASELLRTARELQRLPLIRESFRVGDLGWSKVREITRVVEPHTEVQWLEFALKHTAEQVAREVVLSPRQYKAQQAASQATVEQLSLQAAPPHREVAEAGTQPTIGASGTQATVGASPSPAQAASTPPVPAPEATLGGVLPALEPIVSTGAQGPQPSGSTSGPTSTAGPPRVANKRIRLTVDLTPDQYAIVEQALNEVHRRQGGRRPAKEHAMTSICRAFLAGGSPSARLKSQVIVHTNAERDQHWYETERGVLPASQPEKSQLEQPSSSGEQRAVLQMQDTGSKVEQPDMFQLEKSPNDDSQKLPQSSSNCKPTASRRRRPAVPRAILQAVRARANGRCEMPGCGRGGQLHLHHMTPVSDGGQHDVDSLRLLCTACHALHHETDFEQRPEWRQARERAVKIRKESG